MYIYIYIVCVCVDIYIHIYEHVEVDTRRGGAVGRPERDGRHVFVQALEEAQVLVAGRVVLPGAHFEALADELARAVDCPQPWVPVRPVVEPHLCVCVSVCVCVFVCVCVCGFLCVCV